MYKLLLVIVLFGISETLSQVSNELKDEGSARQKRLLFYDENGNLVKTYNNPLRFDFSHNTEKSQLPLLGKFFGSLFDFFKPSKYGNNAAYMIPVSNEVVQQINNDPLYQNKLFTIPRKELVISPTYRCADKRGQIPAPECKKFLNCWDGWAVEQECPEGLVFSKEGYCDYAQNVDCERRLKDPSPAPVVLCTTEFETWRNEQKCNEFFVCVDKAAVKFKCPADLLYNTNLGVCDYKERVPCNAPPSFDDATLPSPAIPAVPILPIPSLPAPGNPPASIPAAPVPVVPIAAKPCDSTPAKQPSDPIILAPGNEGLFGFGNPRPSDGVVSSNAVFNSQSWSSTHVAISRQDAIRQLKADVSSIIE